MRYERTVRLEREAGTYIILAPVIGRQRCGEPCIDQSRTGRQMRKLARQRFEEEQGADEARNGVSRKAEHRDAVEIPDHQRFSRSHGDAPEIKRHAAAEKRRLDEIVIADRSSSEGDEHVHLGCLCLGDGAGDRCPIVADDAEIKNFGPVVAGNRSDPETVRSDDLVGAKELPGGNNSSPVAMIAIFGRAKTGSSR